MAALRSPTKSVPLGGFAPPVRVELCYGVEFLAFLVGDWYT